MRQFRTNSSRNIYVSQLLSIRFVPQSYDDIDYFVLMILGFIKIDIYCQAMRKMVNTYVALKLSSQIKTLFKIFGFVSVKYKDYVRATQKKFAECVLIKALIKDPQKIYHDLFK